MKYLQRYLSLLFALVMCLSLFSVTASAKELDVKEYNIYIYETYATYYSSFLLGDITVKPDDGTVQVRDITTTAYISDLHSSPLNFSTDYYIGYSDKGIMFEGGLPVTMMLQGVRTYWVLTHPTTGKSISYSPMSSTLTAVIYYNDGSVDYADGVAVHRTDGTFDFKLQFTPNKDVLKVCFTHKTHLDKANISNEVINSLGDNKYSTILERFLGEVNGDSTFILSIDQETKETSLLGGILGKLGDVWSSLKSGFSNVVNKLGDGFTDLGNKLTSGFSELGNKLTGIFDAIINLPNKLWELISNGLKSLFVPSEESMVAYKDKWDELLSSRFGAVYQVVNIMTDSWDGVINADETNTINFPSATINFSGTPFTFGGYDVKIVPDGFEVLVTAIKSIVGIVCTVAFVNGMRKRYDEVMGVET